MEREISVTLTFPRGALFAETIEALRRAKASEIRRGNIEAGQTIHTLLVLAEGGLALFEKSATNPFLSGKVT
jgi:hypothetical protein